MKIFRAMLFPFSFLIQTKISHSNVRGCPSREGQSRSYTESGAPRAKARGSSTCFEGRNPSEADPTPLRWASRGTLCAFIHGLKSMPARRSAILSCRSHQKFRHAGVAFCVGGKWKVYFFTIHSFHRSYIFASFSAHHSLFSQTSFDKLTGEVGIQGIISGLT